MNAYQDHFGAIKSILFSSIRHHPTSSTMQAAMPHILGPKKNLHSVLGRVALITGASQGIGFNVARGFLEAKAKKVILLSYDESRGHAAVKSLKNEYGPSAAVEWHHCDMGNLKEIKEVCSKIRRVEERLDLLVLSAGINTAPYSLDADSLDRHFGVNWLGHFYIVNILYPLLRKTSKQPGAPAGKIVFESSEMHRTTPSVLKFGSMEDINNSDLGPMALYARTKLCMILGVKYGLFEKVIKPNNDNIYALAVHPGTVRTAMQQQWKEAYPGIVGETAKDIGMAFGKSPEQGAYTALYAATSPDIEKNGWNGVYLSGVAQLGKESSQASDPALGTDLWKLSEVIIREKLGSDALVDWNS